MDKGRFRARPRAGDAGPDAVPGTGLGTASAVLRALGIHPAYEDLPLSS